MTYRGTQDSFLELPLHASTVEVDGQGNLWRVEVRKDPDTGLTLKGRMRVPSRRPR